MKIFEKVRFRSFNHTICLNDFFHERKHTWAISAVHYYTEYDVRGVSDIADMVSVDMLMKIG
jgi:hypothetical protein